MKTFKQYVKKQQVNEGAMDWVKQQADRAAQGILDLKKYQPTSTAGKIFKGAVTGDAEPGAGQYLATAWELVDPSGIASIDDAVEAYTNFSKAPNPITGALWMLSLFCCVPNLGLFIGGSAGAAAGAPAAGVGAVPGAITGGIIGGGMWVSVKAGVKTLLKRALKNPEKHAKELEEMASTIGSFVRKTPGGPEAIATTADRVADLTGKPLSEEGRETITKMVGEGTGVKVDAAPKPKEISKAEYDAMSPEKKAEFHKKSFAKAASIEDDIAKSLKDDGVFQSLVKDQKWNLSKAEGKDVGVEGAVKWIVHAPSDKLISDQLSIIASKHGATPEQVINGIKKAYPDIKFAEPKTAAAAIEDVAAKTAAKAATETGADVGVKAAAETSTKAASETTAKAAAETAEKAAAKEVTDSVSKQAGLALGRLLLKPVKYALVGAGTAGKAVARGISNVANQITASVIGAIEKGHQAGGVLGPNKDPERMKRAQQDVGAAPKDNYGEIVYTFNGKILTPAQASALGTFATPARYNYSTKRWEEVKTLKPGQEIPIDYADGTKSDAVPAKKNNTGKYDTTSDFENKLK